MTLTFCETPLDVIRFSRAVIITIKGVFSILGRNLEDYNVEISENKHEILKELENILLELKLLGRRPSTLGTYKRLFRDYVEFSGITTVEKINKLSILKFISKGDISVNTKAIRLKQMKPILNRWHKQGLLNNDFWTNFNIKMEDVTLPVTTEDDIRKFLGLVDLNKFHEFRDTIGVLIMFYTGVRVLGLSKTTENMIDHDNLLIHYTSSIMKNHRSLSLPIKQFISDMIKDLCVENAKIRKSNNVVNDYLIITSNGTPFLKKNDVSTFNKRTNHYKKKYGIETLNPQSLRRGFAKRLLDNGVNLPTISKALDHSGLDVTTRYLRIDESEMIDVLREIE